MEWNSIMVVVVVVVMAFRVIVKCDCFCCGLSAYISINIIIITASNVTFSFFLPIWFFCLTLRRSVYEPMTVIHSPFPNDGTFSHNNTAEYNYNFDLDAVINTSTYDVRIKILFTLNRAQIGSEHKILFISFCPKETSECHLLNWLNTCTLSTFLLS